MRCRTVVDATAGLGRDAFVLAHAGLTVQMLERSEIVYALLEDALARACTTSITPPPLARMSLTLGEATTLLPQISRQCQPDAVYLDPMHPKRSKSALNRKEMHVFQTLLGEEPDAPGLLAAALTCARHRVVVKRPRHAAPIAGPPPTGHVQARSTRFDIYVHRADR